MLVGLQQFQLELEVVNQQAVLLHAERQLTQIGAFLMALHHQMVRIKLDEIFHRPET
jgi:hypothetical protein